jgi:MFS family permease
LPEPWECDTWIGYGSIGVAAPILLVALRFIQSLGLGGEWGGAVLMVSEHGDTRRRGLYASWPQVGVPAGNCGWVGEVREPAARRNSAKHPG